MTEPQSVVPNGLEPGYRSALSIGTALQARPGIEPGVAPAVLWCIGTICQSHIPATTPPPPPPPPPQHQNKPRPPHGQEKSARTPALRTEFRFEPAYDPVLLRVCICGWEVRTSASDARNSCFLRDVARFVAFSLAASSLAAHSSRRSREKAGTAGPVEGTWNGCHRPSQRATIVKQSALWSSCGCVRCFHWVSDWVPMKNTSPPPNSNSWTTPSFGSPLSPVPN